MTTSVAKRSVAKRPPRWARRADARPAELVQAALDLFVDRGYSATRLDDVAQRAGVSKGTIYLYYASKEELMRAAIRHNVAPMLEFAEQRVDQSTASTRELLREVVTNWLGGPDGGSSRGILKLLVAECRHFPELGQFYVEEVMEGGKALWLRLLRRGIARGELRAIDPERYLAVVTAPVTLLAIWRQSLGLFEKPSLDTAVYLDTYIDVLFHGIGNQP
ncbi:MAG TPA: TetR/AcrR family transcriptional regulator [Solimonas sp.]|nr:TetR/AcrR family transcriptional regulator [Solimonas sp.]